MLNVSITQYVRDHLNRDCAKRCKGNENSFVYKLASYFLLSINIVIGVNSIQFEMRGLFLLSQSFVSLHPKLYCSMEAFENTSTHSKILYLFIFCIAGLFLASSFVVAINGFLGEQFMMSAWGIRISSAIQMGFMFFLPAYTLAVWSGHKPASFFGLNHATNTFYLSILAFLILTASMPFISLLTQINQLLILPEWLSGLESWMQNLENSAEETTNLLLAGSSIWDYLGNLLFIGVFAAIAEEFFFRGVIQQLIVKLFKNKHIGVWMTAFIFSLMHLQFYGFLPRVALGVILGYLFLWSNNLWIPILTHFLNNALVVTFNFFFKENSVYQFMENPPISSAFVFVGLFSLSILVYLLHLYQAKGSNKVQNI